MLLAFTLSRYMQIVIIILMSVGLGIVFGKSVPVCFEKTLPKREISYILYFIIILFFYGVWQGFFFGKLVFVF